MKNPTLVCSITLAGLGLVLACGCARPTAPALSFSRSNTAEMRKLLQAGANADSSAETRSAAEPTGWATIKGIVTLNGPAPSMTTLNANKDPEVCAPGGKMPPDETLIVGTNGAIKDVVVYLSSTIPADNPKWEHESYAAAKTAEVIFDQKNCIFLSHMAVMRTTQKMKVLNSDPVGHNTNLDSKRGAAAGNFTVAANGSAQYVPGKASPTPFAVACSIHPWMKANLMVCDSPYFAVTKADGSFEISNVPAGVPLEFRIWQEKVTYPKTFVVNDKPEKKGRFTLTLNNDEQKELKLVIGADAL